MEAQNVPSVYRRARLTRELTWLGSRLTWWSDKEQEYRTMYGADFPLPAAQRYALIRGAKQKRKEYQEAVKQAQHDLAAL